MLIIDNFLIIFSLEVGGQFIGWFGLITNAIVLPLCILALIAVAIDKDLSYIREQLEKLDIKTIDTDDEKVIRHFREYFIMTFVLGIIISAIYLIASVMLIRGTTNVRINTYLI